MNATVQTMESGSGSSGSAGNSSPTGELPNAPAGGSEAAPASVDFAGIAEGYEKGEDYGPSSIAAPSAEPSGDGTGVVAPEAPVPPTASAPASAAAQTAATPPPAAQTPPATAAPVPPTEQSGQPPAAPGQVPATTGTAATPPAAPAELSAEQHREKYLPALEKVYELSDDEVTQFQENPKVALSKLAARLHYEVVMATQNGLAAIMPSLISGAMERTTRETQNENQFFSAWPQLKAAKERDPAAEQAILSSIEAFRRTNRQADMATVIRQAGLLACMTLNIPFDQGAPAAPAQNPVAQVPTTPQGGAQLPARPAGTAGAAHMPAGQSGTPSDSNIFAELAEAHERGEV